MAGLPAAVARVRQANRCPTCLGDGCTFTVHSQDKDEAEIEMLLPGFVVSNRGRLLPTGIALPLIFE
jgi:hypothetical protein